MYLNSGIGRIMTKPKSEIDPFGIENEELFQSILASSNEEPLAIVNLLKFRDVAHYDTHRPESRLRLTGRDAYQKYIGYSRPILAEHGATTILLGDQVQYVVGEGRWDAIWINRYPNVQALAATISNPRLTSNLYHRDAGLENQANLITNFVESLSATKSG